MQVSNNRKVVAQQGRDKIAPSTNAFSGTHSGYGIGRDSLWKDQCGYHNAQAISDSFDITSQDHRTGIHSHSGAPNDTTRIHALVYHYPRPITHTDLLAVRIRHYASLS